MDNSTITTISIRNFKGIEDLQLNAKKLNARRSWENNHRGKKKWKVCIICRFSFKGKY